MLEKVCRQRDTLLNKGELWSGLGARAHLSDLHPVIRGGSGAGFIVAPSHCGGGGNKRGAEGRGVAPHVIRKGGGEIGIIEQKKTHPKGRSFCNS